MDGDGSFDPADLLPLLDEVRVGPGRPGRRASPSGRAAGSGPGTPGLGNAAGGVVAAPPDRAAAHDIAPMRVCRRADLLALGVAGPALRLPRRAAAEGDRGRLAVRRARRRPTTRAPRAPAPRCPARCAARCARPGTSGGCSRDARPLLVVAKAPSAGPGEDPARRRHRHGARRRARRRGAARHPGRRCRGGRRRALPPRAGRRPRPRRRRARAPARRWPAGPSTRSGATTSPQRLADAHAASPGGRAPSSRSAWTPRTSPPAPARRGRRPRLADHDAVLGPAEDGGWWVLALRDPVARRGLGGVAMSTPTTGADTRAALVGRRPRRRQHAPRCATSTRSPTPRRWPGLAPGDAVREGVAGGVAHDPRRGPAAPSARRSPRSSARRCAGGRAAWSGWATARGAARARVAARGGRRRPGAAGALRRARRSTSAAAPAGSPPPWPGSATWCWASTWSGRRSTRPGRAAPSRSAVTSSTGCPARAAGQTALLADGNVGIGGDPVALLQPRRRAGAAAGRVVVELDRPGGPPAGLGGAACADVRSAPFRWSPSASTTSGARPRGRLRPDRGAPGRGGAVVRGPATCLREPSPVERSTGRASDVPSGR